MSTGHDNCPPVPLSEGLATSVFCNGLAAATLGSLFEAHGCTAHAAHQGKVAAGCNSVFICGKPAARTGDPVDCGGTIAGCSGNVNIGDGATTAPSASELSFSSTMAVLLSQIDCKIRKELQEIPGKILANVATVTGVPKDVAKLIIYAYKAINNQRSEDEIIPHIPEIARHIASQYDRNSKTFWGFTSLAEQVERWLDGNASEQKDITETPYLVDLEQVLRFDLPYKQYRELRKEALNEAGSKELLGLLRRTKKLPLKVGDTVQFDFIRYDPELELDGVKPKGEWDYWDRLYFNRRDVKRPYWDFFWSHTHHEGQMAAFGSFTLRSLGKGTVTYKGDGKYRIKLSNIAIYARDAFDFTDDKWYGFWSPELKNFYLTPEDDSSVFVTDQTFKNFRQRYNRGRDFYIFSDPTLDVEASELECEVNEE